MSRSSRFRDSPSSSRIRLRRTRMTLMRDRTARLDWTSIHPRFWSKASLRGQQEASVTSSKLKTTLIQTNSNETPWCQSKSPRDKKASPTVVSNTEMIIIKMRQLLCLARCETRSWRNTTTSHPVWTKARVYQCLRYLCLQRINKQSWSHDLRFKSIHETGNSLWRPKPAWVHLRFKWKFRAEWQPIIPQIIQRFVSIPYHRVWVRDLMLKTGLRALSTNHTTDSPSTKA